MSRQSVSFEVPIRTQGTQNKRDHWRKVANRSLEVRSAVQLCARGCRPLRSFKARPVVVTLVRIFRPGEQNELDAHDNLPAALKPVADELAKLLGFASDRDPDIAFTYGQERGAHPAVRVLIQGPCRARTVIYDVEPGSKPREWVLDPEAHARKQLLENRGVPGSVDDGVALNMAAVEGERDG